MKNLYLILRKYSNPTTFALLKESAEKIGVILKPIYTEDFDFTRPIILSSSDALYSLSNDLTSQTIEKCIINDEVTSFYQDYLYCIYKKDDVDDVSSYIIHSKNNLPVIKSVLTFTNDREKLNKYSQYLGGFPIIIKSLGGSHGFGVMKIESLESLYSVADYLYRDKELLVLRKFIKHKEQARLIVLGDKVIAHHTNIASQDFRTNVGNKASRKRTLKEYTEEIKNIAVKAVKVLGYEFGGVDILFDEDTNKPYIAEVNMPCYFPTTQEMTGINISEQVIDYLIQKSQK